MTDPNHLNSRAEFPEASPAQQEYAVGTAIDGPRPEVGARPPVARRRRVRLPVLLFVATCLSTLLAGGDFRISGGRVLFDVQSGLIYALSVMTILVCHEAGHFVQAWRYGVPASLPFFLPMPFSPIGTFGAVIGMDARIGDRKALFDIGITGPLAGLVPTIICCVVGLQLSKPGTGLPDPHEHVLGTSFLFSHLAQWMLEPSRGAWVDLHPMAMAGWVGLLVTALNLLPIGQLDGGHILYGLLRKKAHYVATLLLMLAVVAVLFLGFWWWWLMVFLLVLMGPKHPPTANDNVSIGAVRHLLGWLTLVIVPLGLPPMPLLR
jgi:membrane-associated protease RseP (regulator of RpoE activity)